MNETQNGTSEMMILNVGFPSIFSINEVALLISESSIFKSTVILFILLFSLEVLDKNDDLINLINLYLIKCI